MEAAFKQISLLAIFFIVVITLAGCKVETNSNDSLTQNNPDVQVHPYDTNTYAMNKLICDPLGGGGNSGPQDGLIAFLYYLPSGQSPYNNVGDYIEHGTKSNQHMFFSQLDVPTRRFELGFPKETGGLVEDDQGQVLNEYFAIRFNSILKLAEGQPAGDYEFAVLSDDGTLFKIKDGDGGYQMVVDNDHNHPTRMGCGETISMDHQTELDVEIDYYQGPRYHISLIPMWRKVDQNTQDDPLCGKKGNSLFFDFNNNSTPQQAYLDLLARGWEPIGAANWHLPPSNIFNPCAEGQIPVISNFNVQDTGEGAIIVTWDTDIPSTSQVLYRHVESGEETLTQSDNVLRTSHWIVINQVLIGGDDYQFHAVSVSESLGKAVSAPILITVL